MGRIWKAKTKFQAVCGCWLGCSSMSRVAFLCVCMVQGETNEKRERKKIIFFFLSLLLLMVDREQRARAYMWAEQYAVLCFRFGRASLMNIMAFFCCCFIVVYVCEKKEEAKTRNLFTQSQNRFQRKCCVYSTSDLFKIAQRTSFTAINYITMYTIWTKQTITGPSCTVYDFKYSRFTHSRFEAKKTQRREREKNAS